LGACPVRSAIILTHLLTYQPLSSPQRPSLPHHSPPLTTSYHLSHLPTSRRLAGSRAAARAATHRLSSCAWAMVGSLVVGRGGGRPRQQRRSSAARWVAAVGDRPRRPDVAPPVSAACPLCELRCRLRVRRQALRRLACHRAPWWHHDRVRQRSYARAAWIRCAHRCAVDRRDAAYAPPALIPPAVSAHLPTGSCAPSRT
jgi:hypothetical protein